MRKPSGGIVRPRPKLINVGCQAPQAEKSVGATASNLRLSAFQIATVAITDVAVVRSPSDIKNVRLVQSVESEILTYANRVAPRVKATLLIAVPPIYGTNVFEAGL